MTPLSLHPARLQDKLLKAAVLVLATAWIYSPVYHGEFLWDDSVLVTDNWMVQSGSLGGLAAIWVEPDGPDYFPLTYTALWLAWMAFGEDPTGYHLVNIALHAISGLLLWRLLTQLQLPGAWLAALVFTVHPVCVESVAWISEIKNTLSLPFFLLACLCWVRQDEAPTAAARNRWYGGAVLAFLLALLAKPTMVGLPLLTLVYAWWKRQTLTRQDLLLMVPLLLVAVAMGLVTIWYQQERAIGDEVLPIGGPLSRLAVAGMAIAFYLVTIVWPVGLMPVYPQWSVQPVEPWQLLPWVGLAGAAWFSWKYRGRWGRHVILAGGFFLLMIAPVLGFVDMAFMRFSWVSDHFLYLPMIGPIALIVGGLTTSQRIRTELARLLSMSSGLAIFFLVIVSHAAAANWVDTITLWTYTLEGNPNAWPAHLTLGNERLANDDVGAAFHYYSRAGELFKPLRKTRHYRSALVETLIKQRKYIEALQTLEGFLREDNWQGSQTANTCPDYEMLAVLQKAKQTVQQLRQTNDDDEQLLLVQGRLFLLAGETARAQDVFLEVLTGNPLSSDAKRYLEAVRLGN